MALHRLSGSEMSINDLLQRALEERSSNPVASVKFLRGILNRDPSHAIAQTMLDELEHDHELRELTKQIVNERRGPLFVLRLQPGATDAEIKKAYRALSMKVHPDKNHGNPCAAAAFIKLKAATDALERGEGRAPSQPDSRAQAAPSQPEARAPSRGPQPRAQTPNTELADHLRQWVHYWDSDKVSSLCSLL
ncbi:hypothetical protein T492DRAFT_868327 [Pavlovales sp. CCMP2436]|nr:hypothetical protein T492DRAFT_868327 [Pavlovales sp. CCMP2436]